MSNASPQNQPSDVTAPFEQVVSLCQAFADESSAGSRPSLDAYLQRAGTDVQPALLRNLLALDLEHRCAAGKTPHIDEYLEHYPQFTSLIRDVFLERSSALSLVTHDTAQPKLAAAKMAGANRLGEYRLLGELGRGGMGVVYEALHLQRGHHVALKTLPCVEGAALHRFKREFRALSGVNHPNLVGLHTLEADGGQWFFTMDLVAGVTFLQHVRPSGSLDEAQLRSALPQLVAGVLALHAQHIIHRDLKPSNVMVTTDGHVVVLDFGLALELDGAGALSLNADNISGTPRYMAPEQAAGRTVTAASDWYAVGVMLYEALAGKQPFSGPPLQVLQDKQRLDPFPLPEDGSVPADLAGLCLRLLAREPGQRPDPLAITRAIASSVQPAAGAVASAGRHLVGREPHLAALKDAQRLLERQREPVAVFISGRSGEGKSTLAEHFLAPLREDKRLVVMTGRCYDRESVPFKALDNLIDALCSYLRSLPGEDAALLMPDDIGALVQVFPVLQRVEVVARAADPRFAALDEQQVRQRAFGALRSLLARISRRSLIVWFIDDLQWGDADSALALFEVLRPPAAPPVLFLGAYRSDETEGSAFLQKWRELERKHEVQFSDREVKLAPLSLPECIELVIDLIGRDTDSVRRRAEEFARETRGNPFLLIELVGCFDPDTDSFEPVPLHEVVARKLLRLPAEAEQLLAVIAISGHSLALEEVARTAGHEQPPMATLTRMRNERLVRLIGPDDNPLIDTYHDRVRETVLTGLAEERCRTLHRTLAEIIEQTVGGAAPELIASLEQEKSREQQPPARVYDLAYHFDAAGDQGKAWVYALLAAEQARRQLALEVAVNHYALAERNANSASRKVRYRIAAGWGAVLVILARHEQATRQLETAFDLADSPETKASIEAMQGELALHLGHIDSSVAHSASALRRLGVWVPRSRWGLAWGLLREGFVYGLRAWLPRRFYAQATTRRRELIGWLLNRLGIAAFLRNTLEGLWGNLAATNRAERLRVPALLSYSYSTHGVMLMASGVLSRGYWYLEQAVKVSRELNDLWGMADSVSHHGIGLHAAGKFEESNARLEASYQLFQKVGEPWEADANRLHWALTHACLGTPAEPIAALKRRFGDTVRVGDSNGLFAVATLAIVTRGSLPFADMRSCFQPIEDNITATAMLLIGEGHWHHLHGRTDQSLQAFEKAYRLVHRHWSINHLTAGALPGVVTALRLHANAIALKDAKQAQRLRQRAFRLAKWSAWVTLFFPPHYPHALRELSHAYAARGRLKKALRLVEKSCAVAEKQKSRREQAESLLLRGKLAKQLGLPGADEQIQQAEAELAAFAKMIEAASSV